MIEHAILLSAGQGSRMLPLTAERPKCMIDFSGRTLIAYSLSLGGKAEVYRLMRFSLERRGWEIEFRSDVKGVA